MAQAQRTGELATARMSVELLSTTAGNMAGTCMGEFYRSSKGSVQWKRALDDAGCHRARSVLNLKVKPVPHGTGVLLR